MKKTGVFLFVAVFLAIFLILVLKPSIDTIIRCMVIVCILYFMVSAIRRSPAAFQTGKQFSSLPLYDASHSSLRFSDVAANAEALTALRETVDYLKEPDKYTRMGARMPRGILLYGPPGTGKTLLAKALAGEANVEFFSLSGSDFVQMYAGVGASRVRELFSKARKAGRCVIFIDEIDALGKSRDQSSSDERDQTLNALLSEMSGFRETDGIIVVAATNRPDSLDPALTRPGRFDRHIEVGLPGRKERYDILKLHSRNKPLSPDIDLTELAANTVRFSGASLENLMNQAAIRAVLRGASSIEQSDIDAAYISTVAGADRPVTASSEELALIALHEAGHAIASICLQPNHRLTRISIIPSSRGAAGYNLSIPEERNLLSKKDLCNQIQVLLAGRAAEMLLTDTSSISSGACNDLSRAAELASAMVMDLGMSGEAAVSLRSLQKHCGYQASDSLTLCRQLLEDQLNIVYSLLELHTDDLLLLCESLIAEETLNEQEIKTLLPHLFAQQA